MFGLDLDVIENINGCLKSIHIIDKALIYGSRAKGNYRTGSDIDITLLGQNLTLKNSVYPLMDLLDDLYLPYKFDISIFDHIEDDNLVDHIRKHSQVFYKKS